MNVLKKLNDSAFEKPYYGLPNLSRGYHEIVLFRESHGKYGRSVVAELKTEIIFLPQYLAEKIDEKDITELNESEQTLYLFFGGCKEKEKNK